MPPKSNSELKSVVKEAIKELFSDDDFLNKLLKNVSDKLKELKKTVERNSDNIEQLRGKIESLQQTEKMNNICIYNLEEGTNENLAEKVLKLCNEHIKVSVNRADIVKCYRIGSSKEKPRPIIVKFERYNIKYSILRNCKNLKGSKIGIMEDMLKTRLDIYRAAQEKFGKKMVYTHQGNIFVKKEDRIHKITNCKDDLNI